MKDYSYTKEKQIVIIQIIDTTQASMTVFTEQLELQFLSGELDIAITDHGENPRLEVSCNSH